MWGLTVERSVISGNEICFFSDFSRRLSLHIVSIKSVRMNKTLFKIVTGVVIL